MRIGLMGCIGVGKSSIAKALSLEMNHELVIEPVEKNEYLPYFYENKEIFAFFSQNAFYSSLFLEWWKVKDEKDIIFDSTLLSNLVFTEMLAREGIMTVYEVAMTYAIAYKHLEHLGHPDVYVILTRPKAQCFKNVATRGREMEQDQIDYLNFHYDNYTDVCERLIKNYKIPQDKVLWIDLGDRDYTGNKENLQELIDIIIEKGEQ